MMTVTIKLNSDHEEFVKEKIREGYVSPVDVIESALTEWMFTENLQRYPEYAAHIRKLIAEGEEDIRQGRCAPWDLQAMLKECHEEYARRSAGKK